ncbi:hypothetical protein LCGC14_1230390 [marine sediment metagenome]|uniref:Histidine kinase n=1 Tax=marine sediment metagenome TaxID=412755 RepID=A0A0F9LCU3_9ZZZZ
MTKIGISGLKLLIIEDNESDGEVLSDIFKEKGCSVFIARNGSEALKMAEDSSFDISLIDLELPDMNGITILRNLKKENPEKLHYIITGYGSLQTAINAINDGANGYFLKPIVIEDLMHHIQNEFEKKILKQKLKESVEKYRLISENTIDLICIVDNKWKFQYCNEAYERVLGYNSNELIGTSSLNLMHPEDRNKAYEEFRNSFHTGLRISKARIKCKDGTYKWMESFGRIIFDEEGQFKQSVGISRDITERKRTKHRLKESELKYKEAYNKAEFYKDIFTHDINNIISNIKSSIELSALYLKDPNRLNYVEELYELIRGQFKKCSSLISNIRKMSQIDDSVSLVRPVEINDVLKKEIDFTINSYQTRDVKIQTHGFEKIILVNANDLLIDLFNNLLNNAIKYNDSQIVEIDIKMSKEEKNNNKYVKLEFSDNGIGISDERKATLFEKTYVKDLSSKGLGIGLTLVKKIIDSYRGEIYVEDRKKGDYRKGCNFIILIPVAL